MECTRGICSENIGTDQIFPNYFDLLDDREHELE